MTKFKLGLEAAFANNNFGSNFFNWGTIYGGDGMDLMGDMLTYEYGGKNYLLVVGTSFSEEGSTTSDIDKVPVVQWPQTNSWFQPDNYSKGNSTIPSDMLISRFDITDVNISVDEHEVTSNSIGVYPNPTSSNITVRLLKDESIQQVKVINATGKSVLTQNFNELEKASVNLDLTVLPNGIYIININDNYNAKLTKY